MPGASEHARLDVELEVAIAMSAGAPTSEAPKREVREALEARQAPSEQAPAEAHLAEMAPRVDPEESIYVSFAGIVLLHPFIPALLRALELVDADDQFTSWQHRERALFVLHDGLRKRVP